MANPTPEVMPEEAEPYVRIMATGRSDYPNQINNVLCFPGIFRGALDAGAPRITEEMKLAAARGIAEVVTDDDLSEDYVIPSVFNRDVAPTVAQAVVEEAKAEGLARFSTRPAPTRSSPTRPPRRGRHSRHPLASRRMRVLVTGATGLIGSAVCDALLARGDEVVGLTRDPEKAKPKNPTVNWHAWQATTERPPPEAFAGGRRRRQPGRRGDQPAPDRGGQAADPREPGHRGPQPDPGDRGGRDQAEGLHRPVGDRLLRRPRRRRSSTRSPARARASPPSSRSSGRRPSARPRGSAMRMVILRTGLVLTKEGGLVKQLLLPVQARPRRPDRRRRAVHVLDPPRRRGRDDPLGARQRAGLGRRSTPPRPTPVTNREFSKALGRALHRPAVDPGPEVRGRRAARRRARRHRRRRRPGAARAARTDLGYEFQLPARSTRRSRPRCVSGGADRAQSVMKLEGVHHITAITGDGPGATSTSTPACSACGW